MMHVNVNIPTDFTVGVLSHFLWMPPAPVPTPAPTVSIEIPALQLWTMGFLCGQNKWSNGAKPVTHKGLWIMLDGHNTGMLIPDVTIPPSNAYYAIMWPFSSRKVMFAASSVKMNGTAVGCSQWIGLPPIPQMTCGDPISAPVDFSMITITNTLSVGMSVADLLIGLAACAVSMAIDFVLSKVFPPGAVNNFKTAIFEGILGKIVPFVDPAETIKRGLGALVDFGVSALKGDPSFKLVLIGNPDGGVYGQEIEIKPPADSNSSWVTVRENTFGDQKASQGDANQWGTPTPTGAGGTLQ